VLSMQDVDDACGAGIAVCGILMQLPECALAEEELRGTYNQDPAEDGQSHNREQCGDHRVLEFFSLMH
jgi:hypothetical protein